MKKLLIIFFVSCTFIKREVINPEEELYLRTLKYCKQDSVDKAIASFKELVEKAPQLADSPFLRAKIATFIGIPAYTPVRIVDDGGKQRFFHKSNSLITFEDYETRGISILDIVSGKKEKITIYEEYKEEGGGWLDKFPCFGDNENELYFSRSFKDERGLVRWRKESEEIEPISLDEYFQRKGGANNPDYHPQTKKLVFQFYDLANQDLYIFDLKRKKLTQFTKNIYLDGYPRFSECGDKIVFSSNPRPGDNDIFCIDLKSKKIKKLIATQWNELTPDFGDSDRKIAYVSNKHGYTEVYIYDIKEGWDLRITHDTLYQWFPDLSCDGKWIIYESIYTTPERIAKSGIYLIALEQPINLDSLMAKLREYEQKKVD